MKEDEIKRKLFHLSFFENNLLKSNNQFISSILENLYKEYLYLSKSIDKFDYKINELISVIMPVYNDEDTISESIQSILNQSYSNFELIIVDDGSTDNSKNIITSFINKDKRIKYIYQDNKGVAGARNTGIKNSNSNYIKLCDSDDILMPYGLDILIRSIPFNNQNTAIFYDDYINYFKEKNTYEINEMSKPQEKPDLFIQQIKGNIFPVGSVLIRKEIFNDIGYFDENLNGTDDYDMWNRIIQKYEVYKINLAPIYIQVYHDNQLSKDIQTLSCYTDISTNKLINNIGVQNIFLDKNRVAKYDDLIEKMNLRPDKTYDSIFQIINYLQSINYKEERNVLINSLMLECNNKFLDNYLNYLEKPKFQLNNINDLENNLKKAFNKRNKLNKIFLRSKKDIISTSYEYNDFFIEYLFNKQSYYILYSFLEIKYLPKDIVNYFNKNIDLIIVENDLVKINYIESGVIENKVITLYQDKNQNINIINAYELILEKESLNFQEIVKYNNKYLGINKITNFNLSNLQSKLNDIPSRLKKLSEDIFIKELNKSTEFQFRRKIILLEQLIKLNSNNIQYLISLYEIYIKSLNYKQSTNILSKIMKKGFINKKILLDMSFCLEKLGDFKTSKIFFDKSKCLLDE